MFYTVMDPYGKRRTVLINRNWPNCITQNVPLAVWALTLVWSIWAVGMISVTNSLVSRTVKWSVWFTDTSLTVSASLSWLPRLVKPMCRLKMCSTVSSSADVVTEIHIRVCYCHQCCKVTECIYSSIRPMREYNFWNTCNYVHLMLLHNSTSLHFKWKWCTFIWQM